MMSAVGTPVTNPRATKCHAGSRQPFVPEKVHHTSEVVEPVAGKPARRDGIGLMAMVRMRATVRVMGGIIEANVFVTRLLVERILLPGEPHLEEPIVDEEDAEVSRGVSWSTFDNGFRDEGRVLIERNTSKPFVGP
jgi:hypothetical protein